MKAWLLSDVLPEAPRHGVGQLPTDFVIDLATTGGKRTPGTSMLFFFLGGRVGVPGSFERLVALEWTPSTMFKSSALQGVPFGGFYALKNLQKTPFGGCWMIQLHIWSYVVTKKPVNETSCKLWRQVHAQLYLDQSISVSQRSVASKWSSVSFRIVQVVAVTKNSLLLIPWLTDPAEGTVMRQASGFFSASNTMLSPQHGYTRISYSHLQFFQLK